MKGAWTVCCAMAMAMQGAMGFLPLASLRTCGPVHASTAIYASPPTRLRMSTASVPKFSLSLMDDTRVSFIVTRNDLENMAKEVNNALAAFKRLKENAAEGKRPYREDTIMYKDTLDGLNIVVECNPNIFPDPFKAQVFVRVWDEKVDIRSQAMLTKLTDSIKLHMAALKAQEG